MQDDDAVFPSVERDYDLVGLVPLEALLHRWQRIADSADEFGTWKKQSQSESF